jgi:uncharacterized protein (DUF2267 family)
MDYDEFLALAQKWTVVDRATTERATSATLQTLAERLTPARARAVALQLPPELLEWLYTSTEPEAIDVDEFLRRVAERAEVDLATAQRYARAVFRALRGALPEPECALLAAELPEGLRVLLEEVPMMPVDEFIGRVAELTGEDRDAATRATAAVLETLAERIAAGEVRDLIAHLPVQLHEPLRRGVAESGAEAEPMPLEAFVQRVADRAGTSLDGAVENIRAVLATLWEAVDEEYFDVRVQLPPDYAPVLPKGPAKASRVAASRGAVRTRGRGA